MKRKFTKKDYFNSRVKAYQGVQTHNIPIDQITSKLDQYFNDINISKESILNSPLNDDGTRGIGTRSFLREALRATNQLKYYDSITQN